MSYYLNFTNFKNAAALLLIFLGSTLFLIGCAQLYKFFGLTPEQTAAQAAQDQDAIQKTIEQIRWTTHEIISTTIAAAGAIASGFLAKWLGTERKMTAVMIDAIESEPSHDLKKTITAKATSAGIEPQLNARVKALT